MGFSQAIPVPYSMDPKKQICQFVPNSSRKESNPSGVPPKSTSISQKPHTVESAHSASGDSSKTFLSNRKNLRTQTKPR
ncbi:hypothetical protein PIB30_009213 [Stylosanthes scabra]|uniref:Uncharacterized protein n=1 Tax=Stylosanthes scabra TaxID=79078 RepID=A0ABU6Z4V0_9FABA|nr:hypothetical protein [Stylosanthes scabra]